MLKIIPGATGYFNKTLNSNQFDNEDAIKSAQEDLQNKFYEVSQKLYEAAQQAQGGAQAGPQGAAYDPNAQAQGGGQEYTDADYTEVDDN